MIKLFAVVNGDILDNLDNNISATYTRIHYLLNGLKDFPEVDVKCIPFRQMPRKNFVSLIYNNTIKTLVALRTLADLLVNKPVVYFAYPHSLGTVQNRALFRICEWLKLNVVLDIHDTIEQSQVIGTGKSKLSTELERYCFTKATLIVALNEYMWNYLKNKYHISKDKCVVLVPNAYEESFCELFPDPYKSIPNRFNICYLGALTKNRGIEILIKACQELHKKYPYLNLYLFGFYGEGIASKLKETIEQSEFIKIRLVPRKDLPGSLNDVDLFVMPYNQEERYMNFSSPTKLFEYVGTSKPILCTKCESLLQIGKNGGIMYVDYDLADFERKIEMLILNPKMREDMSLELIKIRPNHTWKVRAKNVYEMLEIYCGHRGQQAAERCRDESISESF